MPRVTADLSADLHHELRAWLADSARELGVTRVTWQSVAEVLVQQLTTDPELTQAVRDRLAAASAGE
ncbi:hypothetical protein B7C42_07686 [Nocardia cerradoensis]|uniref:Uncharacterized protein n=1 Tax=Nocardia cerradoensis TaxID=85688 RepID=A0A231GUV1_9NOCA|nr:hypothetical protein [Nocardia cerradoensis]OXR40261.1 hypothetical protein B7C42_07686 [Nocardia cerradoensis]